MGKRLLVPLFFPHWFKDRHRALCFPRKGDRVVKL
jgi:hypothetical protein